jgi:cytidylate kinase
MHTRQTRHGAFSSAAGIRIALNSLMVEDSFRKPKRLLATLGLSPCPDGAGFRDLGCTFVGHAAGEISMDNENTLPSGGTRLKHLGMYWAARRRAAAMEKDRAQPVTPAFAIALSREAGTPASAVAREVSKQLGWQVYDHELLDQIARDTGARMSLLESVDERSVSMLREAFEALMSVPYVSEGTYLHHLVKIVLALGTHGECAIVGRGAAFILPAATTLRVHLMAPLQERIAARSCTLGISQKEATRQLRAIDRQYNDFVEDHFHKDPTDWHHYDLVLNAARWPDEEAARVTIAALHTMQARAVEKGNVQNDLSGSDASDNEKHPEL